MTFTFTLNCDNAAFEGDDGRQEIARIMREAAKRIEYGGTVGPCFDANGNRVGYWEIEQ